TQHPDYAACLNNLAGLYKTTGNYEKAELLFLEAQEIWGIVFGKEHPDYATNLMNLASFYSDMGNNEKAGPLYLEGKEIIKKSVGIEHYLYATSLENLAVYYLDLGNYQNAEPLLLEAKEIIKKTLGVEHPDYAKNLNNLAVIYAKTQRLKESEILLNESTALNQSRLLHSAAFLSEKELSKYNALFTENNSQIASMALVRYTKNSKLTKTTLPDLMYNQILFQKGFLLNAASKLNGLVTTTPELEEINIRLKEYRRRLAIEYALPIAERHDVSDFEEQANTAEKELARKVKGYNEAQRFVKWQEVQHILKEDEVAIEFIYFDNNFNNSSDSVMYAALVLESGSKEPEFIPLFEEKQLTNRLLKSAETNVVSQLYASRGTTPIKEESLTGLYDLIWKPLESVLERVKTIYYSPSGLLHRINFDAIPKNEKTILADKFKLVRLGSTKALVVSEQSKVDSSNRAILFGGINYDLDSTLNKTDTISRELFASTGSEISFSYAERGLRANGMNWGFLSGTGKEIDGLNSVFNNSNFKTTSLSGNNATEEVFKQIGRTKLSPRVLHIATHGYFFPDPIQSPTNTDQNEPVFKMSDHPMIRSGLIFAGGNYAWKEGKPLKEGMEDGILTAYEISQLNLSNTELVVLSACETGLGDIQGNEGVYGLQRAFKIAGAKYLMMSLWQVPDEETKEFMISFYKNWLNKKLSIPDAFRTTQNEMRQRYSNPYLWAGFVLVE
ncbi:MAG: CHAT domain-containing protein, partial [Flavobacteriales bacterium]|nr:CHAT domain-containing protein [Flavobacteriales bacterium]